MPDHARPYDAYPEAPKQEPGWRERLREIIFEADTKAGKAFDVALLIVIVLSILLVMLDSVAPFSERYGAAFDVAEWAITLLFSAEYLLRLACVPKPILYARSFYGIVDLLAILPTYLSLLLPGSESLLIIRVVRLMRLFRVFKLMRFLVEANVLVTALRASVPKVIVFLGTLLVMVMIMGSAMYLVEGPANGFTSIPRSVYWAIVTMTTVGYGDITPQTVPGQMLAALAMLLGYSIIAVPTGIVSAEMMKTHQMPATTRICNHCFSEGHAHASVYCRDCGEALEEDTPA